MFRPKGIALDSEDHLYVVDGLWGVVQVFDEQGRLLYYFGTRGTHNGEFQLPAGLFIDRDDRVFVVDSFNRRVQVFRYRGLPKQATAGGQP
jgi:sugar lactone lactonase YvrE